MPTIRTTVVSLSARINLPKGRDEKGKRMCVWWGGQGRGVTTLSDLWSENLDGISCVKETRLTLVGMKTDNQI